MSLDAAVRENIKAERRERCFRMVLHLATVGVVVAALIIFGVRQADYHDQQAATNQAVIAKIQATQATVNARISCEITTLDSILTELAAAQSAELHHLKPPAYKYPPPC